MDSAVTTADPGAPEVGGPKMSIFEHLDELRSRLIRSFIALAITTGVAFVITPTVFDILISRAEGISLIRIEMLEMVGAYFKVAFITGFGICLPFLLYQSISFVAPALSAEEKRYFYLLLPAFVVCFFGGVAFAYFVMLPPALNFLLEFQSDIAQPNIRVGNYVSLVTSVMFWIGVAFELPLVLYFLSARRITNPWFLAKYRKYAFLLAFVAGAVITPTFDPVNQSIVSLPIYVLYEVGIIASRFAWRGRPRPGSAS